MKRRLFYKILGMYLIVVVLAVCIIGFLVARQIKGEMTRMIEADLLGQVRIATLMPLGELVKKVSVLKEISQARVTLIDASGRVIADSEKAPAELDNHLNRTEIQEARVKGRGTATRYSHSLGVDMLYVASLLKVNEENKGYIRLSLPLYAVRQSQDRLWESILSSLLIVMIPLFLLSFLFSMKITTPIEKIQLFTKKVREGDAPGSLLIKSEDEIGQLARNINFMVERLYERIREADEEKGKLRSAFASMVEGVLVLDDEYRIEALNRGLKRILGMKSADIIGKTLIEAFRNTALHDAFERFRQKRTPVQQEITIGEDRPLILEVNISTIHGLPENESKTMMVFHDVTRLKKLEQMRVDFVANVTHEIKTPLTAIIGFVETLKDGALNDGERAVQFLETIADNARRLNRLVDDLLILSRIELGDISIHMEGLAVKTMLDSLMPVIRTKAVERGLSVRMDIPEDLPPIYADRDRLMQILLNVLDNAVKFTPAGSVTINATADEIDNVVVRISDTGIGIPKDEISRLGERFYRVDKTRSRELGGTGLGLSIVKHLIKVLNGKMEIDSVPGKGTTVSLFLPQDRDKG